MANPASSGFNSDLLKEAIADAKAVRQTALANAQRALQSAFGPYMQSQMFETDIRYPAELEKMIFADRHPWDWPKKGNTKKFTPTIHLRAAIERFKKCMPAERKAVIGNITYKYQLYDFSLIEKNKGSVNSWEDYSFIAKIKVIPHENCAAILKNNVFAGNLSFWFKGEIDVDEDDQISEIQLTDISLKATTKPNP